MRSGRILQTVLFPRWIEMAPGTGEIRWIAFPDRVKVDPVLARWESLDPHQDADAVGILPEARSPYRFTRCLLQVGRGLRRPVPHGRAPAEQ